MRKFSYDDLEPQVRMEFARLERQRNALLAALKQILADWESVGEDQPVPDEINDTAHWDAVREAIRKGEST